MAWRAAAGWLVAHVDGALAVVEAVVLARLPVTVGPSEAFGTSAGGSTCVWREDGGRLNFIQVVASVLLAFVRLD